MEILVLPDDGIGPEITQATLAFSQTPILKLRLGLNLKLEK